MPQADDLDRMAATKIVSVVIWPLLDGSGKWGIRVDCGDDSLDPFSARGILIAGAEHLSELVEWPDSENEDEED